MAIITSKKIIRLLEDFGPGSYPIGNVDSNSYLNKTKIIELINNKPGFAEKALQQMLKTDYSYYIIGNCNPFFKKITDAINSGQSISNEDTNKLKSILIKDCIDILVQVVNFNNINNNEKIYI